MPADRYGSVIFMVENEEPIAYTLGWQPFLGLKIYLDSKPLIPRPETEWWTEQLLSETAEKFSTVGLGRAARSAVENSFANEQLKFLDLCAGSGAIGCAVLARLPNVQVYFGEIDSTHKKTILKNIRENNLDLPAQAGESPAFAKASSGKRAHIFIGNLFEPFGDIKFNVIAANPPYVPEDRELPASVADFEPALALRAGADGLAIIRRIAKELPKHLTKDGVAWIECDSAHAEIAKTLFLAEGFATEIKNDQYGVPRIIVARYAMARYNLPNV
jgi:release factor glutamine methyltransferase